VLEGISIRLQRDGVTSILSFEGGLTCVLPEKVSVHLNIVVFEIFFLSFLTSFACKLILGYKRGKIFTTNEQNKTTKIKPLTPKKSGNSITSVAYDNIILTVSVNLMCRVAFDGCHF
jgi:uncharacterized membrane protein